MMRYFHLKSFLFILIFALLTACSSPATQMIPTEIPSQTPSPLPTVKPTKTVAPTATNISGFEDWSAFNSHLVDITTENGSLILTLKHHALWFMEQRGVLVYKSVDGNFKITADVHTSKNSDPTQPPGGDGSVQLGGLMTRNGEDGDGLSIETKNTTDSFSKYHGPEWDSSDAELRLCRFGHTFNLYKRHVDSNEPWRLAESFDRPDLPDILQVGVNIYTDSAPDLRVQFDQLRIETVADQAACEQD